MSKSESYKVPANNSAEHEFLSHGNVDILGCALNQYLVNAIKAPGLRVKEIIRSIRGFDETLNEGLKMRAEEESGEINE